MNSALLIESTVLEIQELLPYYTKSYIRESIELLYESDEIVAKSARTFSDMISSVKEKGKKIFTAVKGIISKLFKNLVTFNLCVSLLCGAITVVHTTLEMQNKQNQEAVINKVNNVIQVGNEITLSTKPPTAEDINKLGNVLADLEETHASIADAGGSFFKYHIDKFDGDKDKMKKSLNSSLNSWFKSQISSKATKVIDVFEEGGILISSIIDSIEGRRNIHSVLNKYWELYNEKHKILMKDLKETEKNAEQNKNKKERSDEAVLRSYIKNVILENKS